MHEMSRLPLNSLSKAKACPRRTNSGRTGAGLTSRVMPRFTASSRTSAAREARSPVAGPAADGVVGLSELHAAAADIAPAMPTAYKSLHMTNLHRMGPSRPKRPAPAIRRSVPTCQAQIRWSSGHSRFNPGPRPAWASGVATPKCQVRRAHLPPLRQLRSLGSPGRSGPAGRPARRGQSR
jgi:hypothetical protein